MKQSRPRSVTSKMIPLIALSVTLGLTASYSQAQTDDFTKALEARVAARWDFEAERKRTLLDKERFTSFLAGTGAPTHRYRIMAGTAVLQTGNSSCLTRVTAQ